ncbi:tannase and feruloyl esterase [Mycena sp. CBHHK59/15]|nr:tannase and feruloyl esterase [Mycena sp. CBHHK59/15]
MDFAIDIISKLFLVGSLLSPSSVWNSASWASESNSYYVKCLSLKSNLNFLENTTILDVSYVPGASKLTPLGTCGGTAYANAPLCRVQFVTNTTDSSAIHAEAWLPDNWHGRFLGLGNGGLGGCIDYVGLDYGTSLHFAAVGSNNGHDGSGRPFLGHPEVINDFAFRAIHAEAVVGKQIVAAYYGRPHAKSYYLGCSTGGRQGTQAALKFPEDFDGIVAGAPATDFNRLLHWSGMLARHAGAPDPSSPAFIPPELWQVVSREIFNQCDMLDGVRDGIITEPDDCNFRPEALLCLGENNGECLTRLQAEALRKIYSPFYVDGELWYPRYDPGAEASPGRAVIFSGAFPIYPKEWLKYAVLNVSDFDFGEYGVKHGRLMEQLNPGGIATFNGDLSAFRDRGGKFLTYHGRVDPLIASGNSKRVYNLISHTLGMPSLDAFYRLFLVPGMDHCTGGPGASNLGQRGPAPVNASSHNILLALVDWVEGGRAPDTIIGTADDGETRVHCRYPMRSVWDGKAFRCTE